MSSIMEYYEVHKTLMVMQAKLPLQLLCRLQTDLILCQLLQGPFITVMLDASHDLPVYFGKLSACQPLNRVLGAGWSRDVLAWIE
jgi:hypothetical protein